MENRNLEAWRLSLMLRDYFTSLQQLDFIAPVIITINHTN